MHDWEIATISMHDCETTIRTMHDWEKPTLSIFALETVEVTMHDWEIDKVTHARPQNSGNHRA